jgi:CHAT domain-containing protein
MELNDRIMKPVKFSLALVAIAGLVGLNLNRGAIAAPSAQPTQPSTAIAQSVPTPKAAVAEPASIRLNLEKLIQSLDRGDVADAIRQVELGWKKQFEDYYQGQLTSRYLPPDEIQRSLARIHRLTNKKTALVYAIPAEDHLELMLVTPDKILHRRITAAPRKDLLAAAQRFRMAIVNPESQPKEYLQHGKQLHDWMIAPLENELRSQNVDVLLFCMGTGLRSLPMAALHDGQKFLTEKYNLAIIPAFNLLDRNPAVMKGLQVLAMGASEFKDQPPLPAVPAELSAITGNLWTGKSFLNSEFTIANLKAQRSQTPYGIVHLATHAEFLPGSANESYIQFWDQPLRPTQLRNLGLRIPVVQLLVLSACRTALGNPQAELGFAGLAVQSGSKATIASLWSVSDAGTFLLMTELYRELRTAPIKAEALRQAQLAMIRRDVNINTNLALRAGSALPPEVTNFERNNLSHPYYWAAFTLIGNPW